MGLVDTSFEDMLNDIDFTAMTRYDLLTNHRILPPYTFRRFPWSEYAELGMITPEYVQELAKEADIPRDVLHEAFENAFGHGNCDSSFLPVSVKWFKGNKGYVVRIRDTGEGFDYHHIISERRNGRMIFKHEGWGFYHYASYDWINISFEGSGNIINIQSYIGW
ncbi:MAG: ATP-binding protein [Nanoarchaeota archaeon]